MRLVLFSSPTICIRGNTPQIVRTDLGLYSTQAMVSMPPPAPGVGHGGHSSSSSMYAPASHDPLQPPIGQGGRVNTSNISNTSNSTNNTNNTNPTASPFAAPFLRSGSNGAPRDFLHESHGGLRFASDVDDDDSNAPEPVEIVPWRMRERMKTMDVALVLCLNIGTDPPDIAKASPCARKECWVDPFSMPAQKALETIGKTLQSQYERWQPRARYRQSLDPTVDEIKQLGVSMRRHAKHDRVLFHYNGHGVPRPTPNGEVWVFNKSYTQYIPLLVYDLQSWLGTPSIYVFDCSAAGILLSHFNGAPPPPTTQAAADAPTGSGQGEAIVLAACGADEILPMNPELCADVFTSCLTTPITVALRWFIAQNEMSMSHVDGSFIDRIPGKLTDRKTPLGELNWIFTAITDTIAWNVLPRELFQKLFRQDLLVASLFRNFLLAERIMKSEGCAPCSLPALPPTNHHPLWRSWDLAAEICLNQLYKISHPHPYAEISMQPSRFFAEQLTAFEVWLQFGSPAKAPPQQLPMVLQVLLSQVHRLRALILLKKFLDLGPWAVNLALSVGIFPYVLKLLQSPASELRQVLVFIWAKILALDPSCQVDLVKDDGHSYFITHLAAGMQPSNAGAQGGYGSASGMPSEQKVLSAFILSVICNKCPQGQKSCLQQYLHRICANTLADPSDDVRRWICLCLAKLWENFEDGKRVAIDNQLPKLLSLRLHDERPEVRAAAAYAMGTLVGLQFDGSLYGPSTDPAYVDEFLCQRARGDMAIAAELLWGCQDASPFVRRESVLALANVVLHTYHQPRFEIVARHFKSRSIAGENQSGTPEPTPNGGGYAGSLSGETTASERPRPGYPRGGADDMAVDRSFPIGFGVEINGDVIDVIGEDAKYYVHIWHVLKEMQARDPFPKVVSDVKQIVSRVNAAIWAADEAAQAQEENTAESNTPASNHSPLPRSPNGHGALHREGSAPTLPTQTPPRSAGGAHDAPAAHDRTRQQGGRPVLGHAAPHSTGTMRPSQSVGNFRANYTEEYGATASAPDVNFGGHPRAGGAGGGRAAPNALRGGMMPGGDPTQLNAGRWPGQPSQPAPVQSPVAPPALPTHGRQVDFPEELISTLYDRQKARFNDPNLEPLNEGDDPLSEKGGEKLERIRRFERLRKASLKIAPGFATTPSAQDQMYTPGSLLHQGSGSMMAGGNTNSNNVPGINYPQNMMRSRMNSDKYDPKNFTMTVRQRAVLNNEAEMTSLLLFHPYEKMLIVADEKDQISLYNFEQSEKKALCFGNKNPLGSRLTSLSWINETEESLLTCGSDDGVIRIYHGLHAPQPAVQTPSLLTAFVAVPDLVPGTRGSGLVTNWQQGTGMLYAGGNSSILRGWNMRHERCAVSIPTQTDSCITTLTSDETTNSGLVVAGFGDGSLRLFDVRASRPEFTIKSVMGEHASWVVQTHLYAGKHELLSGSVSGELKFWDLRYARNSVRTLEAHRSPMTALAVHDYAPIFASGSHNQFIKVFRSDGEQLALIRYHEGFLGERIGPVSCLAFHPHHLLLAAGATDSVIAIYGADK